MCRSACNLLLDASSAHADKSSAVVLTSAASAIARSAALCKRACCQHFLGSADIAMLTGVYARYDCSNYCDAAMVTSTSRSRGKKWGATPQTLNNLAQALALPAVLAGGDVILAAETGSGKTLAYLLPLMQQLLARGQAAEAAGQDGR